MKTILGLILLLVMVSFISISESLPLPSSSIELNFPKRTPIYRTVGGGESEESEENVFKDAQDEQDNHENENMSGSEEEEQSFKDFDRAPPQPPTQPAGASTETEFDSGETSQFPWHRTEDDDMQMKSDGNIIHGRDDENEIHDDDDEDEEEVEDDDKDEAAQLAIQSTSSYPLSPWEESSYGVRRRSGLAFNEKRRFKKEDENGDLIIPILLQKFYGHW